MNTNDGEASISRHTARGILPNKYTLVPGDGDGTVDGTGAAGGLDARVIFPAILAAIAAYLVS